MKYLRALSCMTLIFLAGPSVALAGTAELRERSLTTPTGWLWYTSASEETINRQIDKGYRPIDVEVVGTSPYRFAVTLVKNSGEYRRSGFWWYFGKTSAQVKSLLRQKKARIIDLEVYWVGGHKRYAVVLVTNTGGDSRAWWYYSQIKYRDLKDKIAENRARLIDLDTYVRSGTRYYSAVMVRNTGQEAKGWWWYTNLTSSGVKNKLRQHRARIVDLERRSSGRYAVVLERAQGQHWSWFVGVDYGELKRLIGNWGHRIADLERYRQGGSTRYAVMMLNNSNALETAVGDFIRPDLDSDGTYGFYLRRRGGSTLASRRATVPVYPASTFKVAQHLHAMRQVDAGNVSLDDTVTWYDVASESCQDSHQGHTASQSSLRTLLQRMMVNSDNQATNAVQEFFGNGSAALGRSRINATARNVVGMSDDTALVHKLGCGGASNDPSNLMRLDDVTLLYDRVASGAMMSNANRTTYYSLMLQNRYIDSIIDQEAPPGVDVASFKSGVRMAHKAGSVTDHKSIAGWVRLPTAGGSREYVYGVFLESGDDAPLWDSARELLRHAIRSALQTFQ